MNDLKIAYGRSNGTIISNRKLQNIGKDDSDISNALEETFNSTIPLTREQIISRVHIESGLKFGNYLAKRNNEIDNIRNRYLNNRTNEIEAAKHEANENRRRNGGYYIPIRLN